jgi:hypothetical protein
MFVSNHVLAGGAIGLALRRKPTTAFAVGVASHLAMDMVPHWGAGCGEGATDRFMKACYIDGSVGLAALAGIAAVSGRRARIAALAGALGAAALDADKPSEFFFGRHCFPDAVNRFHGAIQRESPEHLRRELVVGAVLATTVFLLGKLSR